MSFFDAVSPEIVVPRLVVNTGEGDTAQIACSVQAYPKVKVTWEKEILNANGPQSSVPVVVDVPNSRYEISRQSTSSSLFQGSVNASAIPAGPTFILKIKQVQGPQDFGRYRCRAENRVGVAYSDYITLTGTYNIHFPLFSMIYLVRPGGRGVISIIFLARINIEQATIYFFLKYLTLLIL